MHKLPKCLVPGFIVLVAVVVAGGRFLQASTPDWLRTAAGAALPKYPDDTKAVMLLNEQRTTVAEDGAVTTRYRHAYRILRPEGRPFGTVAVEFGSEIKLTYLKAWCIPANGKDYEVKEKEAIETALSADSLYADARRKIIEIPQSEPGSVVGYEYEEQRRPEIPQDSWGFQTGVPVLVARYELLLPPSWSYQAFWLNADSHKPEQSGNNTWTWELRNVRALEDEPRMPAWEGLAGHLGVTCYRKQESAEGGESWKNIGTWYSRLASAERQGTPEIQKEATELTASETTTLGKIRALANFVQSEIRYVAIEIGPGGYQPHPAQVTFVNRYGDCKDKATLLAAILKEVGINSWYVLVDSDRGVVNPAFPTMLAFDHVILAVQLPADVERGGLWATESDQQLGTFLYFDPTDPYTPLGYLPEPLQNSYGLLVSDQGGQLRKLPLLPAPVNRLLRSANLSLAPDGTLSGEVTELRWGCLAAELRAQFMNLTDIERQKALETGLGSSGGAFALEGSAVDKLDQIGEPLTVYYRFTAANYAKSAGNLLLFKPEAFGNINLRSLETPGKERKNAVEFSSAALESEVIDIRLPQGYAVDESPQPANFDSPLWGYKTQTEIGNNVLHYKRIYQIKSVEVPVAQFGDLKRFSQQVASDQKSTVVLKSTVARSKAE